jgi:hypothetical protein
MGRVKERQHFLRKQQFWEPVAQHWFMCWAPRFALVLLLGLMAGWLGGLESLLKLIQVLAEKLN